MNIRTSKPSNNKFYITTSKGGYSQCIQGKPADASANVLANCVGYACGRFNEIIGSMKYPTLYCNAENFIERAKSLKLEISSVPTLGGIMVWQKGSTLGSKDGAGHVAIVERIDSANQIYTSESSYGGTKFYNSTRTNSNGRWGIGAGYTFRGCIVNPAIGKVTAKTDNNSKYKVNTTYTTQVILAVREKAGKNNDRVPYEKLTANAKANAYVDGPNKGYLKEGTRVTCYEVKNVGNDIWIRIPSGWVAGYYQGKTYIK